MSLKVAVLGSSGMLGYDLSAELMMDRDALLRAYSRGSVDVRNRSALKSALVDELDWVINLAAYTNVDQAETETEEAFVVNADAPKVLAEICEAQKIRLLHVSTDYVFDGTKGSPYVEDDAVNPINAYGQSKWEGEEAVRSVLGNEALIVRLQSLFGKGGNSFVSAIRNKLQSSKDVVSVVNDQITAPSFTGHIAEALCFLIHTEVKGTMHLAASGACTWFEFAEAIAVREGEAGRVQPIPSAEMQRPAKRPAHSVLDSSRFEAIANRRLPLWEAGLDTYYRRCSQSFS